MGYQDLLLRGHISADNTENIQQTIYYGAAYPPGTFQSLRSQIFQPLHKVNFETIFLFHHHLLLLPLTFPGVF